MNKYGAIAYGPAAFLAGYLVSAGSSWAWLGLVPGTWFVGMIFSHLVFKRCVLTELAARMSHWRSRNKAKAMAYALGASPLSSPIFVEGVDGQVIPDEGFPRPIKNRRGIVSGIISALESATSTATTITYEKTGSRSLAEWAAKTVS